MHEHSLIKLLDLRLTAGKKMISKITRCVGIKGIEKSIVFRQLLAASQQFKIPPKISRISQDISVKMGYRSINLIKIEKV